MIRNRNCILFWVFNRRMEENYMFYDVKDIWYKWKIFEDNHSEELCFRNIIILPSETKKKNTI